MDKWGGKVAVVTGASSGIGEGITKELVHHGLTVVGLARRVDKMETTAASLASEPGKFIGIKTDLRKEEEISAAFTRIDEEFGGADILVNNSGVADSGRFLDENVDKWREILEVNVLGLCICTKLFLESTKRRNLEQGHIININSVLGHMVSSGKATVYQASKHAVTAICKSLRHNLAEDGSTLKVTSISPGFTRTSIVNGTAANNVAGGMTMLAVKDVVEAVISVLSASPGSQICEVTLTPVPAYKKFVF